MKEAKNMTKEKPLSEKEVRIVMDWGLDRFHYTKDVAEAVERLKEELIMKNRNAPIVDKIMGSFNNQSPHEKHSELNEDTNNQSPQVELKENSNFSQSFRHCKPEDTLRGENTTKNLGNWNKLRGKGCGKVIFRMIGKEDIICGKGNLCSKCEEKLK